jgi:hypothetical protein
MPLIRSGKRLISVNLHVAKTKIGETWLTSLPYPFPGTKPLPCGYVIKRITLVLRYQLNRENIVNFLSKQHLHSQESGSLNRGIDFNLGSDNPDQRVGLGTRIPTLSRPEFRWANPNSTLKPFFKQKFPNVLKLCTHCPILKPG